MGLEPTCRPTNVGTCTGGYHEILDIGASALAFHVTVVLICMRAHVSVPCRVMCCAHVLCFHMLPRTWLLPVVLRISCTSDSRMANAILAQVILICFLENKFQFSC